MGSILPVTLIGVIATFLLGVLVQFPTSGNVTQVTSQASSGIDLFRQVTDRLSIVYTGVLDDLISYQRDPNYQRLEDSRQKMTGYAESVLPQFQAFTDQMQGKLGELTSQYAEGTDPSTQK